MSTAITTKPDIDYLPAALIADGLTLLAPERLENIRYCVEDVLARNVPGDFLEAGVWQGGACMLMRAILNTHGAGDRLVWVADSFAGFPAPDCPQDDRGPGQFGFEWLRVSEDEVRANFERYGLLDEGVRFLRGWFKDTLPLAPVERLAVLRVDCDLYRSTMDVLTNLYPRLSVGGYVIIDDYNDKGWACKEAVDEYRALHGITEPMQEVDWTAVYWRKEQPCR